MKSQGKSKGTDKGKGKGKREGKREGKGKGAGKGPEAKAGSHVPPRVAAPNHGGQKKRARQDPAPRASAVGADDTGLRSTASPDETEGLPSKAKSRRVEAEKTKSAGSCDEGPGGVVGDESGDADADGAGSGSDGAEEVAGSRGKALAVVKRPPPRLVSEEGDDVLFVSRRKGKNALVRLARNILAKQG